MFTFTDVQNAFTPNALLPFKCPDRPLQTTSMLGNSSHRYSIHAKVYWGEHGAGQSKCFLFPGGGSEIVMASQQQETQRKQPLTSVSTEEFLLTANHCYQQLSRHASYLLANQQIYTRLLVPPLNTALYSPSMPQFVPSDENAAAFPGPVMHVCGLNYD